MEVKCRNVKFKVSESQHADIWQYIINDEWEQETFNVIDYFVKESHTVIDIGCWLGTLSFYLAAKGASVYAIDPDPVTYPCFLESIRLNPEPEPLIFPFDMAITPKTKTVTLHSRKTYGGSSSSVVERANDQQHSSIVKGISLYDFIISNAIPKVDFIKMDIESGEFEVLPSLADALKQLKLPTMIIEFHYPQLNEIVYQDVIRLKLIARIMMKIEKKLGVYFFKSLLISRIKTILPILKLYPFIYDTFGNRIEADERTAKNMLANKLNLVLSTYEGIQPSKSK
jgi:FkbM family methyltransferase